MNESRSLSRWQYDPTIEVAYTRHPSGASTLATRVSVPQSNAGWFLAGLCLGVGVVLLLPRQ